MSATSGRAEMVRQRLLRSGLVAALLAGVLVATFGAGYRTSEALLGDASAYLQREHHVVRVNAEGADVDAEAAQELATGDQRLQVVQVSAGVVYVVNTETDHVWRLPTDTMAPQPVDQHPDAGGGLDLATGGDHAYLMDAEDGTLALLEDPSGTHRAEVALPDQAPVSELVVDSSGVAWALSRERGELYAIDGATVLARHPVAGPGEHARLTLAGDQPVVYLPARGVATWYGRQGSLGEITVPPEPQVEVAAPGAEAPVLVTVVRRTSELVTADRATGETARIELTGREGNRFGPPVLAGGRVYVPDYTERHVVLVQLQPLREQSYEKVAGRVDFEVFARDGRVWVNDPYHPELLTFDPDGRPSRIDKSTGDDVPAASSPPAPQQTPPPEPHDGETEPAETPEVAGPDRVEVPPIGRNVQETCAAIKAAGLACRPEVAGYASSIAEYLVVVSTEPPPGTEVEVGSDVVVGYLGQGETYLVPDVRTMSPEQACQTLRSSFLQCVLNAAEVHWQMNTVHVQSIAPGAQVPPSTTVEIVYAGSPSPFPAPVGLTRFRYVGPNGPQPAWHLTTGGQPGTNWIHPHQFGGVYGPNETAVPGLVPVYEATCTVGCGVPTMYFYAQEKRAPNRPPITGNLQAWSSPVAPAFRCFADPVAGGGTAPLMKMYSDQAKAWTFAVQGGPEWHYRRSAEGGQYEDQGSPVCHVWYGVPPFPGS